MQQQKNTLSEEDDEQQQNNQQEEEDYQEEEQQESEQQELTQKREITLQERVNRIITWRYAQKQNFLNLDNCPEQWDAVLGQLGSEKIQILFMSCCHLKESNMNRLVARLDRFQNRISSSLIELKLKFNYIGSKGSKLLAKLDFLRLKTLSLESCNMENNGVQILTKWKLDNLESINIEENKIGSDGSEALIKSNWPKLKKLRLIYGYTYQKPIYIASIKLVGLSKQKESLTIVASWKNQNFNKDLKKVLPNLSQW